MVVISRRDIDRMRIGALLSAVVALAAVVSALGFGADRPEIRAALFVLAGVAVVAVVFAIVLSRRYRESSKAVLFHRDGDMVLATNNIRDGFKLRFFRDALGDNLVSFSDEERERWNVLSREGFHPALNIRNTRKVYLLTLCFMVFDEVYVFDHNGRWDYFDCRNTSEPTYPQRGVGPFRDDSVIPDRTRQPAR